MGALEVGITVRTVPPMLTENELKSLTEGLVPKDASVIVAPSAVPAVAPVSKLITVDLESTGELTTLDEVAEEKTKSVPLCTFTLKSVEPSMARNCFCKSAAKSMSVAEFGFGVSPIDLPPTVSEKFLKSVTDGDVPNVGAAIVVVFEVVTPSGVPVETPVLPPVSVSAKLFPPLIGVLELAKPALMLRCACDKELIETAC